MDIKIVYVEALLMDNGELMHYGKTLGFVNKRQMELAQSGAGKITKGGEIIVAIGEEVA